MNELQLRVIMLKAQANGLIEEIIQLENQWCPRCNDPNIYNEAGAGRIVAEKDDTSTRYDTCPDCNGTGYQMGYRPLYRAKLT